MSTKTRTEMGYGFFCGGDPRKFWPDGESCSEKEMENHKAACKLWDEAEARGETPTPEACPSGWVYDKDGKPVMHVLRAPYGIGTYEYEVEDDEAESPNESSSATARITMDSQLQQEREVNGGTPFAEARGWAAWRCPWCGWSNNRQAEGLDACEKCGSETATHYSLDGESLIVKWAREPMPPNDRTETQPTSGVRKP